MKKLLVLVALISVVAFASASAQSVGVRSVGIHAGLVNAEELDATFGIGGYVDIGLPMANVYLTPFVNWWSYSETAVGTTLEASFTDMAFGGKVKWVIPTASDKISPFVGAGAAAHMLKSELSGDPSGLLNLDVSTTKIGWHLGGGLQVGVAERVNIVGQAWYTLIENFNQYQVSGGIAFSL